MQNKENRKTKGLIALVVILSILLCFSIGYICYDKFFVSEDNVITDSENDKENLEKEDDKLLTDQEVNELFDKLLVGDFGIYYDEKIDINNVNQSDLVRYAIHKYIIDNNIDLEKYLVGDCDGYNVTESSGDVRFCTWNDNGDEIKISKDKVLFISKKFIDKELKDVFNLDSVSIKDRALYGYMNSFNTFVYVEQDDAFYYYNPSIPGDGYVSVFDDNMISYEKVGDQLYIYSNYLECNWFGGGYCIISKGANLEESSDDIVVATQDIYHDGRYVVDAKIVDSHSFNFDYIFEKYGDKMGKYKTVFKKGSDGQYYWYSSELVR